MRSILLERDAEHDQISSPLLFAAYRGARKLGARKPVLLQALQLQEADLRGPRNRFSVTQFATLCHSAALELGGVCRTAEMGRHMVPSGFSDLGYSAGFRKTWSAVLEDMLCALDLQSGEPCFHLVRLATGDRLYWEYSGPGSAELSRTVFSMIANWFGALSGDQPPLIRTLNFRQSEDRCEGYAPAMGKTTGVGCSFDQIATFIEFFPGVLSDPNPNSNPDIIAAENRQRARRKPRNPKKRQYANLCYDYLRPVLDKSRTGTDRGCREFRNRGTDLAPSAGIRRDIISRNIGASPTGLLSSLFPRGTAFADRHIGPD